MSAKVDNQFKAIDAVYVEVERPMALAETDGIELVYGAAVETDFGLQLEALTRRGLLEDTGAAYAPTAEGFYLNNEIGLALV